MALRSDQKLLLAAGAGSLALFVIPYAHYLLWPVIILNTHIHEMMHALAAIIAGGKVDHIKVFADGNGLAYTMGGWPILTSSAGYMGAAAIGGLMIAFTRKEKGARMALALLGGLIGLGVIFYVRGDVVGVLSGIAWAGLLAFLAWKLRKDQAVFAARFLGMAQCLMSAYAFVGLWQAATHPDGHSDAGNMEQMTGIPDVAWAAIWFVVSLIIMGFALKAAWKGDGTPTPKPAAEPETGPW